MIKLSTNQIILLHKDLISEFGGLDGVKDLGMLESAINAPFQTFNYQDMYPTIQQKAARLCYGLVKNHPFIDGNKRIGVHAMLVFLALNRIELEYSQEELYSIILNVASSQATIEDLSTWIIDHQLQLKNKTNSENAPSELFFSYFTASINLAAISFGRVIAPPTTTLKAPALYAALAFSG